MTVSAVSSLEISLVQGRKWAIFVYRSITVKIALNPLETGRSVMKSRAMDFHGCLELVMVPINHMAPPDAVLDTSAVTMHLPSLIASLDDM